MSARAWLFVPLTAAAWLGTACDAGMESADGADFAVLARSAEEYAQAGPGVNLEFPSDHGAHPGFRIEWWYLTANLEDGKGEPYGAQWTLFRLAVQPPETPDPASDWRGDQVYMAHFAISTADSHVGFQRYARGRNRSGASRSGVVAQPFSAWLDDWSMESTGPGWLPLDVYARQDDYSLRLHLRSDRPPVPQGDGGFSQKHPEGGGSHYYSQPFLEASGALEIAGSRVEVTGEAWLDREWSSQFLQPDQAGWDWFSLHLENGDKLMLFRLRQKSVTGSRGHYQQGMLITRAGQKIRLESPQISLKPIKETLVAGRSLPLHWSIDIPRTGQMLLVEALHPDQWMDVDFPYWEGAVVVRGSGPRNRGRGYMELTGYPPGD